MNPTTSKPSMLPTVKTTMKPTHAPTVPLSKLKFSMKISMTEAQVTENMDELRKSVANMFNTEMRLVIIKVVTAASRLRRALSELTNLEVEIHDVADVDAQKSVIEDADFEKDLAAEIKTETGIDVTISDVSNVTVSSMKDAEPPKESEEPEVSPAAYIVPLIIVCLCAGGIYYMFTQNKLKWEVENEDANPNESGV